MTRSHFNSVLMFVWLTVGYTAIHLMISFWGVMIFQLMSASSKIQESLVFSEDGEAIIQSATNFRVVNYRQLDGTVIEETAGLQTLGAVSLGSDSSHEPPTSWSQRILAFTDFQNSATNWYLIMPPNHGGRAYFTGYDARSRQPVGYLGLQGFSSQVPPIDQSFPVRTNAYGSIQGVLAATQSPNGMSSAHEPWEGGNANGATLKVDNANLDDIWILSEGTLYEIRLRPRTVRKLLSDQPDFQFLTSLRIKPEQTKSLSLELILRSDSEIRILDPKSGEFQSVVIQPPEKNGSESLYSLVNGKRIIVQTSAYLPGKAQSHDIRWLNDAGQIERQADWTSPVISPDTGPMEGAELCLIAPSPLVAVGAGLIASSQPGITWESQTYLGRLMEYAWFFRAWIGLCIVIGIATGWAVRRRESDVFGNGYWFWPILVGIFGWFGWVGYICLRPLPARLPRGGWLPSRPEPAPALGTEIFA